MAKRETIGQRIKTLRVDQQMKAKDLAKGAGIHPSTLSQIENGRRTPDTDTLEGIARALHTTTAKLVDGASLNTGGADTSRTDESPQTAAAELKPPELAAIRDAVAAAFADVLTTIAAALGDYQAQELHGEIRGTQPGAASVPRKNRG
jgi:transcriptional regulator with XRE-family HTH domain